MTIILAIIFTSIGMLIMVLGLHFSRYRKKNTECCNLISCYEEKSNFVDCYENNKICSKSSEYVNKK